MNVFKLNEMQNVGKAKYVVNYCTGKTHSDGSDFYDMRIFKNKKIKDRFVKSMTKAADTARALDARDKRGA